MAAVNDNDACDYDDTHDYTHDYIRLQHDDETSTCTTTSDDSVIIDDANDNNTYNDDYKNISTKSNVYDKVC